MTLYKWKRLGHSLVPFLLSFPLSYLLKVPYPSRPFVCDLRRFVTDVLLVLQPQALKSFRSNLKERSTVFLLPKSWYVAAAAAAVAVAVAAADPGTKSIALISNSPEV